MANITVRLDRKVKQGEKIVNCFFHARENGDSPAPYRSLLSESALRCSLYKSENVHATTASKPDQFGTLPCRQAVRFCDREESQVRASRGNDANAVTQILTTIGQFESSLHRAMPKDKSSATAARGASMATKCTDWFR